MRLILDFLGAALAVLCLGDKALNEIQGPRTETRNLRSTRRGWGYMEGIDEAHRD